MQIKNLLIFSFLACFVSTQAQTLDSLLVDTSFVPKKTYKSSVIFNAEILNSVFEKLENVKNKKQGKVRIVHMGDSHIQADFLTGAARENLQNYFGNAGVGFLFPHKLIKTNGNYLGHYKSNAIFKSNRVTKPMGNFPVGIAGYSLETSSKNFAIEVKIPETKFASSFLKIITPNNEPQFDLAFTSKLINLGGTPVKTSVHKIKSGETLSSIAAKYNISISQLKSANNLKDSAIRAGKILKVPNQVAVDTSFNSSQFVKETLNKGLASYDYKAMHNFSRFYLLPNENYSDYTLNGIVLENDLPGITYSGIGVNGSRFSDFNKYDLIYNQLQALEPDIIIVSFGTNESFDKLTDEAYIKSVLKFIDNVKKYNPNTVVLATTPPPSSLYRKYLNTYAQDYANALVKMAMTEKNIAVWNLFEVFGGLHGVNSNFNNGIMAKDKVHYTKKGYEQQGQSLSDALIKAFENYILNK